MSSVDVRAVDDLVREYLVFRGFAQTLRVFDNERRTDRSHALHVERIVEHLFSRIFAHDSEGMSLIWEELRNKFFSRLSHALQRTSQHLTTSLHRLFIVIAIQNGKRDTAQKFLESVMTNEEGDLLKWAAILYTRHPETHPTFRLYFQKSWVQALGMSLRNFLKVVFNNIPSPPFMQFLNVQEKLHEQEKTIAALRKQLADSSKRSGDGGENVRREIEAESEHVQSDVTPSKNPEGQLLKETELVSMRSHDVILDAHRPVPITACKYSASGEFLATADARGSVILWETSSRRLDLRARFSSSDDDKSEMSGIFSSGVAALCWGQKTDKVLVVAGQRGDVAVLGVDTGRIVPRSVLRRADVTEACTLVRCIALSPDEKFTAIAYSHRARTVGKLFCFPMRRRVLQNKENEGKKEFVVEPGSPPIECMQFNHNGTLLVTGGIDGMVRVYDTSHGTAILGWHTSDFSVSSALWSRDETCIWTLSADDVLCVWNVHMVGRRMGRVELESEEGSQASVGGESYMVLAADGRHLVLCTSSVGAAVVDGSDLASGIKQQLSCDHDADCPICVVDAHPNKSVVALGTEDGTISITQLQNMYIGEDSNK